MKVIFIPAKANVELIIPKKIAEKLPKKLGIVTTIQHLHKLKELKKQLKTAIVGGQVLGCNAENAKKIASKVDAFLFVGSGIFHPLNIAVSTGKEVLCWNPYEQKLSRIEKAQIEQFERRRKAALAKYYSANSVGIIVSTKHGQQRLKQALKLAARKDKQYYIFIADTININELQNFPFVQAWVNTACPRIAEDAKGIINITDIPH